MTNDGSKLGHHMFGSVFIIESGLGEAAAEFTSFTSSFLCFPIRKRIAHLLVGLSVVLKHLREWVCSAHQIEVIEGDLARDTLTFGDVCYDLSVLLGGSRVFFDCFPYAVSSFSLALINEFINQGRWGLFRHSSARAFSLFLA